MKKIKKLEPHCIFDELYQKAVVQDQKLFLFDTVIYYSLTKTTKIAIFLFFIPKNQNSQNIVQILQDIQVNFSNIFYNYIIGEFL